MSDRIDPRPASTVETEYGNVLAALKPCHGDYAGSCYVDYSKVSEDQRRDLSRHVDALAEPLSQVAAKVSG